MQRETPMTGGRLLMQEMRAVRPVVVGALATLLIGVGALLAGPLLIRDFIDRATAGTTPSVLTTVAVAYLVVGVIGGIARVGSGYLGAKVGWLIADSLRKRLFHHVAIERPVLEVEGRQVGAVLEQVEGNSDIVGTTIAESGFGMLGNVAAALGTLAVMSVVVPAAGIGMAILLVVVGFVFMRLARRAVRKWETARQQQTELFGFVGDSLAARDDLLPLEESGWATERTRGLLASLFGAEGRAYLGGRAFWPLTQLFFAVSLGLALGFGLQRLAQGSITIGTLTMIYLYVVMLQDPLEAMSTEVDRLQRMMAVLALSARSLEENVSAQTRPAAPPVRLPTGPPTVVFEHVTFGYGGATVLHDVSFTVAAGRSLGIVGPTGAGKSTVINLLCGLAEPSEGRVTIGGADASVIPAAELARHVTVLSQQAHLFAASVRDNITLFDDEVAPQRVWAVLEQLGADWVRELPAGLDTQVGASGRQLSPGEIQLLAGARALVRPVGLLIIDEGTSRLDIETEKSWSALLDTLMQDRTVIMVAHRLSTLRSVDEIVVMNDGRVAEVVAGSEAGAFGLRAGVTQ